MVRVRIRGDVCESVIGLSESEVDLGQSEIDCIYILNRNWPRRISAWPYWN
jgi:hypothetical protein